MKTIAEFKEEVRQSFMECEPGLSKEAVASYFEEPEVIAFIEEEYEIYKERTRDTSLVGGDPKAVASTLSLMY